MYQPSRRLPEDWEAVYAADHKGFAFGDEPSQMARSAARYFRAFGGDPMQSRAFGLGSGE